MKSSVQVKQQAARSRWFIVQAKPHGERLAKVHLERQGYEVYLPMRASKSKNPQRSAAVPFLPRYLFLRVDLDAPGWAAIHGTVGVQGIVKSSGAVASVPDALVEAIRRREEFGLVQTGPQITKKMADLSRGDRLRVVLGAFEGFEALFEDQIDARRIFVLLTLFGRVQRVEMTAEHVRQLGA